MRRFVDGHGRPWDAVVGRESWGALFAIFIPVEAGPPVSQTALPASSYEEAVTLFDTIDDTGLRALLERSAPKSD